MWGGGKEKPRFPGWEARLIENLLSFRCGLFVEVGFTHIAFFCERTVEFECVALALVDVTTTVCLCYCEVFAEQWAVGWVCCLFDDFLCCLQWVFEAKVGNALVCNDDVNRVACCLLYTSPSPRD